ncbi:hypothetical protein, partial [Sphingomonas sp.]|uniref:hypothetical protein n=1 Tax=Sphingomonas sp. TaxID=28214 RepID=UPI0035C8268C
TTPVGLWLPLDERRGSRHSDKGPANPAHALILGMPFKDAENGGFVGMVAADILARKVDAAHLHDAVKTLTPSTR